MPRLHLVRHGEAAAGWGADLDPGLSEAGQAQAQAMATALATETGAPLPIVSSPLRRARETAAALESMWGVDARIDPAVGEVPSPTDDLAARLAWLGDQLRRPWSERPPELHAWRRSVIDALMALPTDAVVVTHYVAIGAAVAEAEGDIDRRFHPGYCSRTVLDSSATGLQVATLGQEQATVVR